MCYFNWEEKLFCQFSFEMCIFNLCLDSASLFPYTFSVCKYVWFTVRAFLQTGFCVSCKFVVTNQAIKNVRCSVSIFKVAEELLNWRWFFWKVSSVCLRCVSLLCCFNQESEMLQWAYCVYLHAYLSTHQQPYQYSFSHYLPWSKHDLLTKTLIII